ncbi:hypothetical protein JCM33774_16300 [Actinophytocola sp. KF-1]
MVAPAAASASTRRVVPDPPVRLDLRWPAAWFYSGGPKPYGYPGREGAVFAFLRSGGRGAGVESGSAHGGAAPGLRGDFRTSGPLAPGRPPAPDLQRSARHRHESAVRVGLWTTSGAVDNPAFGRLGGGWLSVGCGRLATGGRRPAPGSRLDRTKGSCGTQDPFVTVSSAP